jgi:branched-chain amino acid transport system substrate-binding protein
MKYAFHRIITVVVFGTLLLSASAHAQKKYDVGASDTEIKIGNTAPYSGQAALYQVIAKSMGAYFDKINAEGGIKGRKIKFISVDDGYNPPKTVEQTRRLVEQEQVLFTAGSIGSSPQLAVQKYLNAAKIPQLFVASGQSRFSQPKEFPWSIGFSPTYELEGKVIGRYVAETKPKAKIAIISHADDVGKDYVRGFKEGVAKSNNAKIVAELTYSISDTTIDSQVIAFKASGADTFFNESLPKYAALGIAKAYDTDWKPLMILPTIATSISSVLKLAGLEKSIGAVSPVYIKDPSDKAWDNDKATQEWLAWMNKFNTSVETGDQFAVQGYVMAELVVEVLKRSGDDLTRENIMKQATSLKDVQLPMLLPGIVINTTPTDYRVIRAFRFQRFDGKSWKLFGDAVGD